MRGRRVVGLVGLLAVVALLMVFRTTPRRGRPLATQGAAGSTSGEPAPVPHRSIGLELERKLQAAADAAALETLKVSPEQVVVRVNGVAVAGKDLVPFAGGDSRQLAGATYANLVDRAVERELALQEARRQGLTLTAAQRKELEAVKQQALARGSAAGPGPADPAEIELEQRDAEAGLLLTELLRKGGTAPPGPTPADVASYTTPVPDDLPTEPAARDAEIRRRLLAEQQKAWSARRRELLDRLEADASISF
jgi:hypothetical protein